MENTFNFPSYLSAKEDWKNRRKWENICHASPSLMLSGTYLFLAYYVVYTVSKSCPAALRFSEESWSMDPTKRTLSPPSYQVWLPAAAQP